MTPVTAQPAISRATRVSSLDVLRGLAMILMALDHTREFLHVNGLFYNAVDLTTTTPLIFFTRWITHYCAPAFVLLAGTSAYLSGQKKSKRQLSAFLLSRGLWLVFLEVAVMNFIFWFDVHYSLIQLQVIWAIGMSMVVLSGLVFLPRRLLLAVGLALVVGHNALDAVAFPQGSLGEFLWAILHQPADFQLTPQLRIMVLYPVLPWIGLLVLGYCLGELFGRDFPEALRRRWLAGLGAGSVVAFGVLRLLNGYGDPSTWQTQSDPLFTCMAFLNVTKYPPSLLYSLITLGPCLLFLYAMEGKVSHGTAFLQVYGRVPLFYYVLHFLLLHVLVIVYLLLSGISWSEINFANGAGGLEKGQGLPLEMVYGVWLWVVAVFYPLCQWYCEFKGRQTSRVWSYL